MTDGERASIEDAISLAIRAHRGQRYPSLRGEPYAFHPLRLMLMFDDEVSQIAAILHDSVEDSELEPDDLVSAGYAPEVIAAVDALTHRSDETYDDYIERVASNGVASQVKLADLTENIANNRRQPLSADIARYERALWRLRLRST